MDTNEVVENDIRAPRGIAKSDIDAQGNVVLWDHGPTEPGPDVARDSDEYKRLEAEAKAWFLKNGRGPVPLTMGQGDAGHAIEVEPLRYSLDPFRVSEEDVEAEIEVIQQQRADAEAVALERAAAIQYAADRKAAIAIVESRRRSEEAAAKAPKPPAPDDPADRSQETSAI